MPLGSVSDLRSRLRPKTKIGISFAVVKCVLISFIHYNFKLIIKRTNLGENLDKKSKVKSRHDVLFFVCL